MLITDFVLSKKVSARDLFGERLKKFGDSGNTLRPVKTTNGRDV